MRYLFTLLTIIVVWVVTVIIAGQSSVSTSDRFVLYVSLVVLTVGLYRIGFARK